MGLLKGDIDKVPKGLSLEEYYKKIYDWHLKNKNRVDYKKYKELLKALPHPDEVNLEDIVFVCREVIAGIMEWAYHEVDESGVKTAAYAHYILDTFFDGFHGGKSKALSEKSRLYAIRKS